MKKVFACTCSPWTSLAIGLALWANAAVAAFSQATLTDNPNPGEPVKADATRPAFWQRALGRLFQRPQTQVQISVVPAQTPSAAVAESKPKSTATVAQESPIKSVSASAQHVPIPAIPTLPYANHPEVTT